MLDLLAPAQPGLSGISLGTFAIGAGMFALWPFLTLYLQNILGYSPFQGGLRLLPPTAFIFHVPVLASRIASSVPAGPMLASASLSCSSAYC